MRDADMDEEMLHHVERLTAQNLAAGMSPAEARRMALLKFGPLEPLQEATRAQRRWAWLTDFVRDLGFAARLLRKNLTFTTVVVATLALGIGANGAIFSLVNAVLLRPLPVRAPEQLVMISEGAQGTYGGPIKPGPLRLASYPLFEKLRAEAGAAFEDLAAQQTGDTPSQVTGAGASDEAAGDLAFGRAVSANYFDLLGVTAAQGRLFRPDDQTAPGANPVVILGHGYWQRRFGRNPGAVGSQLLINGTTYTVIGVTAPGFVGTSVERVTDFWVPATMHAQLWRDRRSWLALPEGAWLLVIGRLRAGVTLPSAEARVNVVFQRFLADNPALSAPRDRGKARVVLHPGIRGVSDVRPVLRNPLLSLWAGAGLLLLIVCFNLSHLLLARAIARQRELGIRAALGAGRARLVRQLLTESLLLCVLGAALALPLSRLLGAGVLSMVWTEGSSMALDIADDFRTLSFTALLALLTALLLGLVLALFTGRADLHGVLRASASTMAGHHASQRLLDRVLLAAQVALSFVLIVGATLLTDSLRRLRQVDKGFDDRHTLLVQVNTPMTGLGGDQRAALYQQLLARITALPGISSASLSQNKLLEGFSQTRISPPGTTTVFDSYEVQANVVTPDYFETLGMTIVRGRDFSRFDDKSAPHVAIINEALARRQFGTPDAVGKRFVVPRKPPQEFEVVGIVRDVHAGGLRLDAPPMAYFASAQERDPLGSLEVRTDADPAAMIPAIRRAVRETRADLPVMSVRTLHQQVERSLTGDRILATTANAFGLAALLLVCVGLYGILSQWAAQRTTEIGVRLALGATPRAVRWTVMREALGLVGVGLGLGLPAAAATTRLVKSLLFGLDPLNPVVLGGVALALLLVAAVAAYLPAWRASRIDPMAALRHE